jgi:hypothetical protein
MAHVDIDAMLNAQQWERCKGELRAMVAMLGMYSSGLLSEETPYMRMKKEVDSFIDGVESNGLIT